MNKGFIRTVQKFDATGESLGRLATKIAIALRGKDQAEYQPHLDRGSIVEVTNIDQVKITGKKLDQKEYHSFSGYPGGLKTRKMSKIFSENPADVLVRAVREMLPDNRLRKGMMKRLNIK